MNKPQRREAAKENSEYGKLWYSLTEEQQEDLLLSYEESFDEKNLIPYEIVKEELMKKFSK